MKNHILSVGFSVPGDEIENVSFKSDRSLLDADIIVFAPNLESYDFSGYYDGKPKLTEYDSAQLTRHIAHWRSELEIALEAGKTVFLFMLESEGVYVYTGEKQYSGTGRNRSATVMVRSLDPYTSVPIQDLSETIVRRTGTRISTTDRISILATYWHQFGPVSYYQIYLNSPVGIPSLVTRTGNRMVGGIVRTHMGKGGAVILLPPFDFDQLIRDRAQQMQDRNATSSSKIEVEPGKKPSFKKHAQSSVGKQFVNLIIQMDKAVKEDSEATATPEWAKSATYALQDELNLRSQIAELDSQIVKAQEKRHTLEDAANNASSLRGLLFETGERLEKAIIQALEIIGFKAQPYQDAESEFDIVFEDLDGTRYIGEAEGKNDRALNIDKLSQLERNIQEDFQKREDGEYAKPVLFGNAFRLIPPEKREEYFTTKCLTGAKRSRAALVRTPDLFVVAKYLQENPDPHFGALCRKAFRETEGTVVQFPILPGPVREIVNSDEAQS